MRLHQLFLYLYLLILIIAGTFQSDKAYAFCIDTGTVGDGWGWDGSTSCRLPLSISPTTHADCTDTPPAGDGWGWNGITSCQLSTSHHSDENSRCIDTPPAGDGWGWDGVTSCQLSAHNHSDENSDCIDTPPAGDGWGWNGSTSCEITNSANTESNCEDTAPIGDGWGWDGNQSCSTAIERPATKIMPVGDSITHGAKGHKSYRYYFQLMLDQANCDYTTVGSQLDNEVPTSFKSPHESYSTMKADHFITGYKTWSGDNLGIHTSMKQFLPDVVLLHIGSNDIYFHESVESTIREIKQLIGTIKSVKPSSILLVSNIVPWFGSSVENRPILLESERLGNAISELIDSLDDDSVHFVDVFTGYKQDMMTSDQVHPNETGEQHIARAFFHSYIDANLCQ